MCVCIYVCAASWLIPFCGGIEYSMTVYVSASVNEIVLQLLAKHIECTCVEYMYTCVAYYYAPNKAPLCYFLIALLITPCCTFGILNYIPLTLVWIPQTAQG